MRSRLKSLQQRKEERDKAVPGDSWVGGWGKIFLRWEKAVHVERLTGGRQWRGRS